MNVEEITEDSNVKNAEMDIMAIQNVRFATAIALEQVKKCARNNLDSVSVAKATQELVATSVHQDSSITQLANPAPAHRMDR